MQRRGRLDIRPSHAALLLVHWLITVRAIPPGPEAHALTKSYYNGVELGPPYNPDANTTEDNHCDAQLVILGLHGSRTSIVTRLMTLLGMQRTWCAHTATPAQAFTRARLMTSSSTNTTRACSSTGRLDE